MNSTALGAKKENINFISEAHEKFYYEKIQKVREADVYHKALCYCLGMNEDTRRNVDKIYNFKTGCVKPECLHEGWQTSGSAKVVRMAFNLYCNGTPSVDDEQDTEEQMDECRRYSVEEIEAFIEAVETRLYNIKQEKISGDNVYQFLLFFDNLYDRFTDMEKKIFMKSFLEEGNIYEAEQEDGRILRSLKFRFPVFFNEQELYELDWDNESTVESVLLMRRAKR